MYCSNQHCRGTVEPTSGITYRRMGFTHACKKCGKGHTQKSAFVKVTCKNCRRRWRVSPSNELHRCSYCGEFMTASVFDVDGFCVAIEGKSGPVKW